MCDIENYISHVLAHPEVFTQTEENIVEEIVKLRDKLAQAEEETERWRESSHESYQLLWGVFHHFTVQGNGVQGPGHLHAIPGVWEHTGKECEWCAEWEKVKTFFQGEPIVKQTQEKIDRFNQNLLLNRDSKYLWHIIKIILKKLLLNERKIK